MEIEVVAIKGAYCVSVLMQKLINRAFLFACYFLCAQANAVSVSFDAEFTVDSDPSSQGWSIGGADNIGYGSKVTVAGKEAWRINDTGTNEGDALVYSTVFSDDEIAALFADNWLYEAYINIPASSSGPTQRMQIGNGTTIWGVRIYHDNGNLVIDNGALGQSYVTALDENIFYRISLKYSVSRGLVNVFLDNVLVIQDLLGLASTSKEVRWGAGSSIETGVANWASLTLQSMNTAPTFTIGGDGKVTTAIGSGDDRAWDIVMQSDGKIVVSGSSSNGSDADFAIARYNPDGTLDAGFLGNGTIAMDIGLGDDFAIGVALQPDGKILVGGESQTGSDWDFALARYGTDGALDTAFSDDGFLTTDLGTDHDQGLSVALQSDGKILLSGYTGQGVHDFALLRYNTDGALDDTFGNAGIVVTSFGSTSDEGESVILQPDGKILVGGLVYDFSSGNIDFALIRYNSDGSLDTTFGGDGKVTTTVGPGEDYGLNLALQPDGKILLAGDSHNGSNFDFALVRYNENGTLDTTFGGDSVVTTAIGAGDDRGHDVIVQPDGKIVVCGYSHNGTDHDIAMVRYNEDGSLDTIFDGDGKVTTAVGSIDDYGWSLTMTPDGKILVVGEANNGTDRDFALVRYNADGSLDNTFGGSSTLSDRVTFVEGGAPVVLSPSAQVHDAQLAALNGGVGNYSGASVTLVRQGGANSDDLFSGANIVAGQASGEVLVSGTTIGVYSWTMGELLVTFSDSATQALVNLALQSIAYQNVSVTPPSSIQLEWTISDGNTGGQGAGGELESNFVEIIELISTTQVTPTATVGGTISPDTPQAVDQGESLVFTIAPDTSNFYHLDRVDGTCGGTFNGSTFTTDPITSDCTVDAIFALDTFRVFPFAGNNGSIAPSESQLIEFGKTTTFTLQGDEGYQVGSVGGTCGGILSGLNYTTNPIVSDCSVTVSFAPAPDIEVQGNGITITHGDASPSTQEGSDFGLISTAGGYVDHTFTVHNDGLIDLTLTNPGSRVLIGGSYTGDFSVVTQPSSLISVGGSSSFIVRFHPLGTGLRTATISIPNNDSDENPYEFAIQGTGGHTLAVTTDGDGTGTVTAPGIDCPGDCSEVVEHNASITLTAAPTGDSIFSGWSGDGCSGTSLSCTLILNQARTVKATFTIPASNPKAIILAGGGQYPGNNIWHATQLLANKAYNALRAQGYSKEQILYLSPETGVDLDHNGAYDDIIDATIENLRQAVTEWATDADHLVIYMMSHGGDHGFRINETEILPVEPSGPDTTLDQWLATLEQGGSLQKVTVVIESCESGEFIEGLLSAGGKRQVITSTTDAEFAYILAGGRISFSYYFWAEVLGGADLYNAFDHARVAMSSRQTAQLDADGDGVSGKFDLPLVEGYCLGNCLLQAADLPEVIGWSASRTMSDSTEQLWASVISTTPVTRVWASIEPPDFVTSGAVIELPEVDLIFDSSNGDYTGSYNQFNLNGDYRIAFYAEDKDGNLSLPASSVFTQLGMDYNCIAGTLTINGEDYTSTAAQTHCADAIVATDSRVHAGANVTYTADTITLKNGFVVHSDGKFHASGTTATGARTQTQGTWRPEELQ